MPCLSDYRETTMDKTPVEIGYQPASRPTPDEIREANRGIHKSDTEVIRVVRSAAATVGSSVQDRADEVIAYTRREPAAALTMATALGFLVGLGMAIGSLRGSGWLAPRSRRQSVIARLTGLPWTGFYR
jgi:hypothetical protein